MKFLPYAKKKVVDLMMGIRRDGRSHGNEGVHKEIGGGTRLPWTNYIPRYGGSVCGRRGAQLGLFPWMLCCYVFSMGFRRLFSHAHGGGGGGGYGVYLSALEICVCA